MIRCLVVDDQSLIREGLRLMLSLYDNIRVVGEASNGKEAVELVDRTDVDLILMDIRMPIMNGIEATRLIKDKNPNIRILMLTTFDEDELIYEGLKSGVDGYLLKDISSDELVKAIETVHHGNILVLPDIAKNLLRSMGTDMDIEASNRFETLTKKEREIAHLVAEGKSNREIAGEIFVTQGTVKNHMTRILDKLQLRDRTQLALFMNEKHDFRTE